MTPVLAVLLHGDDMEIWYFWASILMVTLPIALFSGLTWFLVKAALKRDQGARSGEQQAP